MFYFVELRGIPGQSSIGFLTLLEAHRYCEVSWKFLGFFQFVYKFINFIVHLFDCFKSLFPCLLFVLGNYLHVQICQPHCLQILSKQYKIIILYYLSSMSCLCLQVGNFLKSPKFPVWLLGSETHLTVFFSQVRI